MRFACLSSTTGLAWLVITIPLNLIFSTLYYRLRRTWPIRGRFPLLVSITNFIIFALWVENGSAFMYGTAEFPCIVIWMFLTPLLPGMVLCGGLLRGFLLLLVHLRSLAIHLFTLCADRSNSRSRRICSTSSSSCIHLCNRSPRKLAVAASASLVDRHSRRNSTSRLRRSSSHG